MELTKRVVEDIVIVCPKGDIDNISSPAFENQLFELLNEYPEFHLLVNMQEVEFITSIALKVFVTIAQQLMDTERSIALCEVSDVIYELVKVIRLDTIVQIFESENMAIRLL